MGDKKRFAILLLFPCVVFITLFLVIPTFATLLSTLFGTGNFSLGEYVSTIQDSFFQQVFWRSIRLSLITVAICLVLGFPAAYFISKIARKKSIFIAMTLFPLMTSPVVRSFSWLAILGKRGMLNGIIKALGVAQNPPTMLYTETAIVIGLCQLFLPLMIMSTVGVMENIDDDLVLASDSLGSSPASSFWRIVFPLSVPGLISGSVLVFCGSITAYTTPQLLGGSDTRMLATLVYQDALSLSDWQAASIVAVVMILISVVVTQLMNYFARKLNPAV